MRHKALQNGGGELHFASIASGTDDLPDSTLIMTLVLFGGNVQVNNDGFGHDGLSCQKLHQAGCQKNKHSVAQTFACRYQKQEKPEAHSEHTCNKRQRVAHNR